MITDITNIILTTLDENLGEGVKVIREYQSTNPQLPCVVITEGDLSVDSSTMDSSGYHHTNYEITLDIFTEGDGKITQNGKIRSDIDSLLSGTYKLQRIASRPIPNMIDTRVYRYRLTYVGKLDINKTIYGR